MGKVGVRVRARARASIGCPRSWNAQTHGAAPAERLDADVDTMFQREARLCPCGASDDIAAPVEC